MKITVLVENATSSDRFIAKHGLSLFLEVQTAKNRDDSQQTTRILFDVGPDKSFLLNASKLGVDMAINPIDIVTSNLAKMIQGKRKIVSNQLIQGQAEITEIIASHNMKIANKPIRELDLPDGVIIGAIHRGTDVMIPDGSTVIKEGDRVLIFSLLSALPEMAAYTRN